MAINNNSAAASSFASIFGAGNSAPAKTRSADDRPKAKVWLNVGRQVDCKVDDGTGNKVNGTQFIALPMGLAMDTMEEMAVPKSNKNQEYKQIVLARNNLMAQIQKAAEALQPGEELLIPLQVQIRRVEEAQDLPEGDNPFVVDLAV